MGGLPQVAFPPMAIERIGVPFPSWTGPTNGANASEGIVNPHLSRAALLQPRFHRFLRYDQAPDAKTQTAIFTAGRSSEDEEKGRPGASVVSALNPRNGDIVWRSVFNDIDPISSMHLSSDILVTISGIKDLRVSMLHAPTGQTLWVYTMPNATNALNTGLVDAALIPPSVIPPAGSTSTSNIAPDVIAMDRSGAVARIAGLNGHPVWVKEALSVRGEDVEQIIPLRLHSAPRITYVVSLVPQQRSLRLFGSSEKYSIRVYCYSTVNGALVGTIDVPNSDVALQSSSSTQSTGGNVVVIGQDAHEGPSVAPHLVWLQTDGTVRSVALPLSSEDTIKELAPATMLKPKTSSRFTSLVELTHVNARGLLVAQTSDEHGEVLRIGAKEKRLISQWEFEEEAKDAVYYSTIDRKGMPYVSRVFFGRGQHLLNVHVLWADTYKGEGQVTGFSFQYDHDLNGDVLAAPFEVSQMSEYQLITRATFVTGSSSIRMIQEEKHHWIREEGLSHTTASIMIDLPEGKLSAGAGNQAKQIIDGETFAKRLQRHALALQSLPSYVQASVFSLVLEIPKLSLESFGIGQQRRPAASTSDTATPAPTQKHGAAPLGGVGAQKAPLGGAGNQKRVRPIPPPGVPPPGRRDRQTKTAKEEEPPHPPFKAPREANSTVVDGLIRDKFGFRKLIVATSRKGKIYAVDGMTGTHIWEKSLVGFGQGEGDETPDVNVKFLALTRPLAGSGSEIGASAAQAGNETHHAASAQLEYGGLLTVVAEIFSEGTRMTRMWELEPLTGRFPGGATAQTGIALFPGASKAIFLLPVEDEKTGQLATAAVKPNDDVLLWPTTPSIAERFADVSANFFYTVQSSIVDKSGAVRDILVGYTTIAAPQMKGEPVWRLPLSSEERIVSITRASQDPIASQGKVLGDRKTMYKYLNPHLLVVLTKSVSTRSATVYLIDGVRGQIVHQAKLCSGDLVFQNEDGTVLDPQAVLTENWLTVKYDVLIPEDDAQAKYKGAHQQTRLMSIELYERADDDAEKWRWKGVFSSFASKAQAKIRGSAARTSQRPRVPSSSSASAAPGTFDEAHEPPAVVYSQVYVLPYQIRGLEATRTKSGISTKAIVIATADGRLQVLPRRMLDPRRPVGRKATTQELEERLIPYEPLLADNGKFVLGGRRLPLPKRIHTRPSQLESTSVVFVDQSLDWFVTTVAPSGSFDLLSASFNKPQLLLTIAVLSIAYFISRPMLASKSLRMRW